MRNLRDNEFSKKVKRIFILTGNTKMLHWNCIDMDITENIFSFGVMTKDFEGMVSILKTHNENEVGVSYCTMVEGNMDNAQVFTQMMNNRIKNVNVGELVKHIESLVTKPVGQPAPQCSNVPRVAIASW